MGTLKTIVELMSDVLRKEDIKHFDANTMLLYSIALCGSHLSLPKEYEAEVYKRIELLGNTISFDNFLRPMSINIKIKRFGAHFIRIVTEIVSFLI